VYRGIKTTDVSKYYTMNRRIHWSAYTSTTEKLEVAKAFAYPEGVVIVIQICNGKVLGPYSIMPAEEEVLLSPNMAFIVCKEIYEIDQTRFIELIQEASTDTFIF